MKCFVIMPYGNREKDLQRKQGLDSLYEDFIRPAVEAVTLPDGSKVICHRGDKAPGPGEIITHIIENLVLSELAIADLTDRNPNVFYELGVRHAVNDNTILISENEEDVPFDLRGQRLILYERSFEGGGRLRNEITRAVQELVRAPNRIDNPVRRFLFDRERDKKIEDIKTQGRPPGYDFVKELLEEMSGLRSDFKAQVAEMRSVMQAVTAPLPTSGVPANQEDLRFLEGAWRSVPTGSHYYARLVSGVLVMPYCYTGDVMLHSHFFNFRRLGDHIVARFEWLNGELSGYALAKIDSHDHLIGSWWYSEDIGGEAYSLRQLQWLAGKQYPWELWRLKNHPTPNWAEEYFRQRMKSSIIVPAS